MQPFSVYKANQPKRKKTSSTWDEKSMHKKKVLAKKEVLMVDRRGLSANLSAGVSPWAWVALVSCRGWEDSLLLDG